MIISDFFVFSIAGAIAGLLSGLLGVGGGIILVPILTFLFTRAHFPELVLMHTVLGTSLATIILTSFASARAHYLKNNINLAFAKRIGPFVITGTLAGVLFAALMDSLWLKVVIALFELLIATHMLFNFSMFANGAKPTSSGIGLAGLTIGIVSSLVGIGGGTLLVPYLTYCKHDIRHAIGTSAAIGLPIAMAGTLGYAAAGLQTQILPSIPQPSIGYIYLPAFIGITLTSIVFAPLGVSLAQRLSVTALKRLFALLLFVVGISMLWEIR